MKNIVFLILDEFADWETAFLASALNEENITQNYSVSYASTDKDIKVSMGNLKIIQIKLLGQFVMLLISLQLMDS